MRPIWVLGLLLLGCKAEEEFGEALAEPQCDRQRTCLGEDLFNTLWGVEPFATCVDLQQEIKECFYVHGKCATDSLKSWSCVDETAADRPCNEFIAAIRGPFTGAGSSCSEVYVDCADIEARDACLASFDGQ